MRIRMFFLTLSLISFIHFCIYVYKHRQVLSLTKDAEESLKQLALRAKLMDSIFWNTSQENLKLLSTLEEQYESLKSLTEESRRNFLRIKGVHEKPDENLDEKIVELASYLDVVMTTDDVERVYRVGKKGKNGARTIVAQLANYEVNFNQLLPHIQIKQQLIREASALHRDLEFSIQDDVTNYVISGIAVKTKNLKLASDCGIISSIGGAEVVGRSSVMFGAWIRDPASGSAQIWVMSNFFENRVVEEFANLRDVTHQRPRLTYELPYDWAGTGHTVHNGSLYFNKWNSSVLVKYSFEARAVVAERSLPGAVFGNHAPYQWSGSTDIDLSVDEFGLWVIYATPDNALDIVISKLDFATLEVMETWRTNLRKQWAGNAFMACGVLYVLKKYDEKVTSLNYMYNTRTKIFKRIKIPFINKYEWTSMLSYNHQEKRLYSWDRGFLINYNVTFTAEESDSKKH